MQSIATSGIPGTPSPAILTDRARLVGLCYRLTGDRDAAEDLAQETLFEGWDHRAELRDPSRHAQWLAGIARNRCLHWLRGQGREAARRIQPMGLANGEDRSIDNLLVDDLDLEIELERSELADLLDRAMASFPPDTRRVLLEKYIEELPQAEIARRLGVAEGAIEARLHRGKLALRKVLTTRLVDDAVAYGLIKRPDATEWQETRIWCSLCALQVRPGEVFGLLGPNGAGKTTLVLQILGLLAPTSGSIVVHGVDAVAHPDRIKSRASYMPQTRVAMRNLEVDRALHTTGRLRGLSDKAAHLQVDRLVERLGLEEHRRQYLDRLSGGLIRVAAFAMALMGTPRLIILDEPTNELDPIRRRVVWDYIREIGRSGDVTCLLVTHNVLEAERAVDRVAMIDKGRVVALGTPGELKAQLGEEVRLEVVLRAGVSQNGSADLSRARLATLGRLVELRVGHYAVFVPRPGIGRAVDLVLTDLASDVDDFRLAPPSLEDVYISLAGQKIGEA